MNPKRVRAWTDESRSRQPAIDFSRIASLLADHAEAVCRDFLLTSGRRVGREWKCGDVHNNPGKSLAVTLTGADAGLWYDQSTQCGGNLLHLIRDQFNVGIKEAAQIALEILHVSPDDVARYTPRPPPVRQPSVIPLEPPDSVRRLWHASRPAVGSHGHDYLRARGLTIDPPASLRFHPAVPYWFNAKGRDKPVCLGSFPALICGICFWPSHTVVALQRIYLDPKLPAKLSLPDPDHPDQPDRRLDPKKTLGAFKGGAVRLSPYDGDLALCEGVETALTVLEALGDRAVWATCGTTGYAEVLLPQGGRKFLYIDNDMPGIRAAHALVRRISGPGEQIFGACTGIDDADFNDVLKLKLKEGP
jgi:hypothetical protein